MYALQKVGPSQGRLQSCARERAAAASYDRCTAASLGRSLDCGAAGGTAKGCGSTGRLRVRCRASLAGAELACAARLVFLLDISKKEPRPLWSTFGD